MKEELAQKDIDKVIEENKRLKEQVQSLREHLDYMRIYYNGELEKINFERFFRLNYRYLRKHGLFSYLYQVLRAFKKIFVIMFRKICRVFGKHSQKKQLRQILKAHRGKKIIIFYPGYDWHMRMYQRPQHMAIHFSQKDLLFFYCTTNVDEKIDGFEQINDNLYVTNLFELLKRKVPHYTLYMCANMNGCWLPELQGILDKGNSLLYEYIDDLHENVTNITHEVLERHQFVLEHKEYPVVTTAHYLFDKAVKLRGGSDNILLSTNGVVYEDFHITGKLPIPDDIKSIVSECKPIIGYYGAIAKWFDYDLVEKIALEHKEWNIVLIGIDYDDSFAQHNYFKHLKNVHYLGIKNYRELINYGNCCSVLTIPFLINEITLSTSPVKVFEYMSMEKPIVTTDLPECRKYQSVHIGKTHEEFIEKLELAIKNKDNSKEKTLLRKEALQNTWAQKVEEILHFVGWEKH